MNVTITENPALDDIEVSVACPRIDERVQRIVASLGAFDRVLIGERDGATFRVGVEDVCYAETVDGKTFLYTADAVYQTPLKLYELEERLAGIEADARELRPCRVHPARPERAPAAHAGQRRGRHRVAPVCARHQAEARVVTAV